jgi:hypothetical protein
MGNKVKIRLGKTDKDFCYVTIDGNLLHNIDSIIVSAGVDKPSMLILRFNPDEIEIEGENVELENKLLGRFTDIDLGDK